MRLKVTNKTTGIAWKQESVTCMIEQTWINKVYFTVDVCILVWVIRIRAK